jgi:hypothetical protein
MAFLVADNQHFAVVLEADDVADNPVPFSFPTPPVWSTSDPSILTVSANADGSNADVETTGKLGSVQLNVQGALADGTPIVGTLDVQVTTSKAVKFKLIPNPPADKF